MANASFQQTSFLGGEWSDNAQGRMTDPNYQRALAVCYNGMPLETGAWTRRPGFRFLGITRKGQPAKLFQFDFSTTQPYQIELTAGYLRLWAGLALVMADNPDGYTLLDVSTDNPAKITIAGMPATWANGDTAFFFINTEPCSAPLLCNRQFTMRNVDTTAGTFTLEDPITGLGVDGSTLGYTTPKPGSYLDKVAKVFELATPYTGTQWQDVRVAHSDTTVALFHPSYAPRILEESVAEPFTLTTQTFNDGPYLDINTTTTTLTPSGTSGSITITASSTTGINGGDGFKSTDVGRHIRFMAAPAAWSSGSTYAKAAQVTGSDGNIYQAVQKSTNKDPTTDDGTNWLLVGTEPVWAWLTITAFTDNKHVTATVEGSASNPLQSPFILPNTLPSTTAQTTWQLGFYSDTDGWPTLGTYHEGRLWLANSITPNRFDGSVPDDYFNFCPTASDGTVSDGNAISATLNANEVDAVFWMNSTDDGLIIGAQGSEFRIRASSLDDPISPTSIQARRVSTFGSYNAEAILPWNRTVFLQRHQRKMLALRPSSSGDYDADNVGRLAQQFFTGGIEEIRWQQEPTLTIWMRDSQGALAGCVYRSSAYSFQYSQSENITDTNFSGFFEVAHAYDRSFTSISTGPSYDGLSSALYAVTNQTDSGKPDYNVYHVEYLMPVFDDAVDDWAAYFVDGGSAVCCAQEFLVSNGDAFNGVRLQGLTLLNGLSISVVIGGLDLGDYTVANGYVDIVFGTPAAFTQAFFEGLDGTNYGEFEMNTSFVTTTAGEAAPHPAGSIGSWVNSSEATGKFALVGTNRANNYLFGYNSTDGYFDVFNYTTFDLITSTAISSLQGAHTFINTCMSPHPNGKVYVSCSDPGVAEVTIANNGTPSLTGFVATTGSTGANRDIRHPASVQGPGNYLVVGCVSGIGVDKHVNVLNVDTMAWLPGGPNLVIDEDNAYPTNGPWGTSSASTYITGFRTSYGSGDSIGLYRVDVFSDSSVATVSLGKIAPADIDATWTTFSTFYGPLWCATDNTLVFGVTCSDSVTHTAYTCKLDPNTMTYIYKIADHLIKCNRGTYYDHYGFVDSHPDEGLLYFDLSNGSNTHYSFNGVFINLSFGDLFDETDGGCLVYDPEWAWSTNPTFLGTWSQAHGATGADGFVSKLYFGLDGRATSASRQYRVPASIGLTYTSKGQLLPPNYGYDAGARNGPAFGKKRRTHWYAAKLHRTQAISFGTDFGVLRPAPLMTPGGTPTVAPTLFSDTISTTIDDDYSFKSQIAWEITRPYPAMIVALGGYIETQDK